MSSVHGGGFQKAWRDIQARMGAKPKAHRNIKKTLGKDDFLKIMVTQLKFQDPTTPLNADKMAAQMAQMTSVEQLQNMNHSLNRVFNQKQSNEKFALIPMIGKYVSVDPTRFMHPKGKAHALSFQVPKGVEKAKVFIFNGLGEKVFEKNFKSLTEGVQNFNWNGKKDGTLDVPGGVYFLKTVLEDPHGRRVRVSQKLNGKIIGMKFEGKKPIFLVKIGKKIQDISFNQISSIRDEKEVFQKKNSIKPSNYFTFKKGKGSIPVSTGDVQDKISTNRTVSP